MKLYNILFENDESNTNQKDFIVFFDMDGVLADFDKGINENKSFLSAREKLKNLIRGTEFEGLNDDDLKKALKGNQKDPERAQIKKAFKEMDELRYSLASAEGFFEQLEPFSGAREMLVAAKNLTGKLPNILTAPIESNKEVCEKEKRVWMENHFSGMYDRFICKVEKYEEAQPNAILIDDRAKNIGPFIEHGGLGILHKNPQDTIKQLEKIVNGTE